MTHLSLKRMLSVAAAVLIGIFAGSVTAAHAASLNTTIDFTGFTGAGFAPNPAAGQLDSDEWALTGASDGDLAFGGTGTSGDFARGTATAGAAFSGGVYAFDLGGGNIALGVQPSGADLTPGTLTLKLTNDTGSMVDSVDVAYDIIFNNDQPRANSFNLAISTDGSTFTSVPVVDFTTPQAADTNSFQTAARSTTLSGLGLAAGGDLYLQWQTDDVSGSGSRDEIGLDNIVVSSSSEPEPVEVRINEIRIDQPGGDDDEYFELAGTPGGSLDGLTYITIGDGTGGSGVIEAVVDLSGQSIPGDGLFVAAEGSFTLGTADLTADLNFENSDNVTHLLVKDFTGASDDDLDTNDDGTLDTEPWSEVVDSLALIEDLSDGELVYSSEQLGPDGSFVPGHAYRCETAGTWTIGEFGTGTTDTPGAVNPDCPAEEVEVRINEIRIDQPGSDDDEYFELAGTPGGSLDGLTYITIGDGTGGSGVIEAVVDLSGQSIPGDGLFVAAEGSFTLGTADLTADLNFENSDNVTHLLVKDFTGANGDDLDTNDDGTLDSEPWSEVVDSLALIEDLSDGELVYSSEQLGPDGSFVPGHAYRCEAAGTWTIGEFGTGTTDTPGAVNPDCSTGGELGQCGDAATLIHAIQGSSDTPNLDGQTVVVEGIVVGDFQDGLDGFFIQEEDADWDTNDATSEGIFIYAPGSADVNVGDTVRVLGAVDEFFGQTQIDNDNDNLAILDCNQPATATAVQVTFPLPTGQSDLEAVEGMLVEFTQTLAVTDSFNLGEFGEVTLAFGGPQSIGTEIAAPGTDANAVRAENARNRILVDDGSSNRYLDPVPYASDFSPETLRRGDETVGTVTGVMGYGFSNYRLQPTSPLSFTQVTERPAMPEVGGDLRIANLNVLNYFTTIDDGANDARGADSANEFERQEDKLVAAMLALNADIFALQELENNGTAIVDLTAALNAALPGGSPRSYTYINTGVTGTGGSASPDAITVGIIYDANAVTPTGTTALLESGPFDGRSRPPVAQAFTDANGASFIMVVNHYKSKGCSGSTGADQDQGDGQGCWNALRTQSSLDILTWLATDPTGTGDQDVLIIGDLNSYTQEDPITALEDNGYTNLLETYIPQADRYSYVFFGEAGVLDHALANGPLAAQVTGAGIWQINSDEPRTLDYNDEIEDSSSRTDDLNRDTSLYLPDQWRSSDHDALLIGLNLDVPNSSPIADAGEDVTVEDAGNDGIEEVTLDGSGSSDPNDNITAYSWTIDGEEVGTEAELTYGFPLGTTTVTLTVIDAFGESDSDTVDVTVNPTGPAIISLQLVDGKNDVIIGPLEDGAVIDLQEIGHNQLNVLAEASEETRRVRWEADGPRSINRVDGWPPFTLAWATQDNFGAFYARVGVYELTVTPYDRGDEGEPVTITVTIIDGEEPATPTVTGLQLVDAKNDVIIGPLEDGAVIDLANISHNRLNVLAAVDGPTRSVRFDLDGPRSLNRLDGWAPFTLAWATETNFGAFYAKVGTYTLEVTPYREGGGGGAAGETVNITFEIVDSRNALAASFDPGWQASLSDNGDRPLVEGQLDWPLLFVADSATEYASQRLALSGTADTIYQLSFAAAGRDVAEGGRAGALVTFYLDGEPVATDTCILRTRGTFRWEWQTCDISADTEFDEVVVMLGWRGVSGGLLAFDDVRLMLDD